MFPLSLAHSNGPPTNTLTSTIIQTWNQYTGVRFAASGILGNAIFFGLDKLLLPIILQISSDTSGTLAAARKAEFDAALKWVHQHAESVSFFVAYALDIVVQRAYSCHCVLFRETISRSIFIFHELLTYTDFINALLVFGLDTIKTRELYLSSLAASYTA
ncbi:hypothetical protein ACHAWO_004241 [Cyclotella atomus]|jgi:hypothetical protein|uniref:Uncharacterized protein n=1 Tax=Cyclotella atomus TaxID=382360 RepID=A0ABD3PND8_9STRA